MKNSYQVLLASLIIVIGSMGAQAKTYNTKASGDSADAEFEQEMMDLERASRNYRKRSKRRKAKSRKKIGINVVVLYNSVSHIGTTSNSANDGISSGYLSSTSNLSQTLGEYKSSPSFGLGAEFSKKSLIRVGKVGFGFGVGANYEFEREIERQFINYSYTAGTNYSNTIYGADNPTMSLILPYLNANVSYKQSYLFGGLNYSVPNTKNMGDEEINGKMGYQVGLGTTVSRWVAVEVVQRWTMLEATPRSVPYYNSVAYGHGDSGLGITSAESLNVSGLTLNLKVLF